MDSETQSQLDDLKTGREAKQRERRAHQQRLEVLEEQAAKYGIDCPPHITNEIVDLRVRIGALTTTIQEIEKRAARLALAPISALVLPDGSAIPELNPAVVDTRLRALERQAEAHADALQQIRSDVLAGREDSREWREEQRIARRDGQWRHRAEHVAIAVALLLIAAGVGALLIRVF